MGKKIVQDMLKSQNQIQCMNLDWIPGWVGKKITKDIWDYWQCMQMHSTLYCSYVEKCPIPKIMFKYLVL